MRHVIAGLVLTACMLPVAAASMKLANEFTRVTKPHEFTSLESEPLWTSEVKRVDVAKQSFERLPGLVSPENLVAQDQGESKGVLGGNMGAETNVANTDSETHQDDIQLAAQNWCSERYRSYDAITNSYQPFNGGPRKPCVAPVEELASAQQVVASDAPMSSEHLQWCSNRYSSYDAADNSYQPYSGARKQCISPEGRPVTADVRSRAADLRASLN